MPVVRIGMASLGLFPGNPNSARRGGQGVNCWRHRQTMPTRGSGCESLAALANSRIAMERNLRIEMHVNQADCFWERRGTERQ